MSGHNIGEIVDWLAKLRDANRDIEAAGARAGERRGRELGIPTRVSGPSVVAALRARKPIGQIPVAMQQGMHDEFERKAR